MENKPKVIRRSSEFDRLKKSGLKQNPSTWLLMSYMPNDLGYIRYGYTLTRKVGSSVIRNKLKRWSREYFRKIAANVETPIIDINLVFKPVGSDFYKKLEHTEFDKVLEKGFKSIRARSK